MEMEILRYFKNSMILKDLIAFVIIFFQIHLRSCEKELIKQNQLDDSKVKIFKNHGEFSYLTKD